VQRRPQVVVLGEKADHPIVEVEPRRVRLGRSSGQKAGCDLGRRLHQVLAVVEYEKRLALGQVATHRLGQGCT